MQRRVRRRSGHPRFDVLVVGAGFAGSVVAQRLASRHGLRVCVVDRRDHIAGAAHDYTDEYGVLCHRYGPHIFHTKSARVLAYLSKFTEWRPFEYRVLARVDEQLLPMPINRDTIECLYGIELEDEAAMARFLEERAEPRNPVVTSEDVVVSRVGRDLYERFFRGYTRKHWRLDPSELDASVCGRIPVRLDRDDRYFTDPHQCMPAAGYTALIGRILSHELIDVRLSTSFDEVREQVAYDHLVYSGPIDEFYGHRFGELEYRSVAFDLRTTPTPDGSLVQPAASIHYPGDDVPYTRSTEYRWLTGQEHDYSTVAYEFSVVGGEPSYPVPRPRNRRLYAQYRSLAAAEPHVTFVGRLARYQYLNMDQVTAQALAAADRLGVRLAAAGAPGR
jgi:UDP-galactopyranose mutase